MKWCEIFKIGKHKDSQGNERIWTQEDLNKIKENFKNINPDVPICCGHTKTNSPAYGWVNDLKIAGKSLYADFKDVQNEFKEAVNKGLFKTRSISLTPDLILRHIAFLGAQPPAIKGLEQFCFETSNDKTDIIIEFENNTKDLTKGEIMDSQESLKQELDEKVKKINALEAELAAEKREKQTKEFEDFCTEAISKGNILPKQKADIINILEACSNYEPFEFEDGTKKNAADMFKDFISGLKQMDFEEIALKNKVEETNSVDFQDISSLTEAILNLQTEYRQKGIDLSSDKALAELKKRGK